MTTVLCETKIMITPGRRQDLLRTCKRLGLSWPALVCRVQAAMQDAAVREMMRLCEPGLVESPQLRSDGVTMTPAVAFETVTPTGGLEAESAALSAEIAVTGDELQSLVHRLNALVGRPNEPAPEGA